MIFRGIGTAAWAAMRACVRRRCSACFSDPIPRRRARSDSCPGPGRCPFPSRRRATLTLPRASHRPHSPENGHEQRSERSFASKLRRVRDEIRDKALLRIRDGTMLQWIRKEEDRAVGISMEYDGHEAIFVDLGDNLPPNPGNGTEPIGNPGPIDFPFNDPLNVKSWDALQTVGLVVFGLTTVATTVLCLLSGRRSNFRGKSVNSSATLGSESGINELLEWSNRCMPPQYRHRRDDCAPILVQMPAQQWEDPSVLYPHDPFV